MAAEPGWIAAGLAAAAVVIQGVLTLRGVREKGAADKETSLIDKMAQRISTLEEARDKSADLAQTNARNWEQTISALKLDFQRETANIRELYTGEIKHLTGRVEALEQELREERAEKSIIEAELVKAISDRDSWKRYAGQLEEKYNVIGSGEARRREATALPPVPPLKEESGQ